MSDLRDRDLYMLLLTRGWDWVEPPPPLEMHKRRKLQRAWIRRSQLPIHANTVDDVLRALLEVYPPRKRACQNKRSPAELAKDASQEDAAPSHGAFPPEPLV